MDDMTRNLAHEAAVKMVLKAMMERLEEVLEERGLSHAVYSRAAYHLLHAPSADGAPDLSDFKEEAKKALQDIFGY
jgi:hypothetical protein